MNVLSDTSTAPRHSLARCHFVSHACVSVSRILALSLSRSLALCSTFCIAAIVIALCVYYRSRCLYLPLALSRARVSGFRFLFFVSLVGLLFSRTCVDLRAPERGPRAPRPAFWSCTRQTEQQGCTICSLAGAGFLYPLGRQNKSCSQSHHWVCQVSTCIHETHMLFAQRMK